MTESDPTQQTQGLADEESAQPEMGLVVARARNGVIGHQGGLPWHLPNDLQFFKRVTLGAPIIMGRRTHLSIGRPLPGRRNLIITSNPEVVCAGCEPVGSLDEALAACVSEARRYIIGGASLYRTALPLATHLYLTEVQAEVAGDTFLDPFDESDFEEIEHVEHPADERHLWPYTFRVLRRRN